MHPVPVQRSRMRRGGTSLLSSCNGRVSAEAVEHICSTNLAA